MNKKRLLIVLPTYNEKDNITRLVNVIFTLNSETDIHCLIIDDNSPDGTGELVDKTYKGNPKVNIIHRPRKSGLGSAYIKGFKFAIENNFDYVCEMDADFSHDPAYLTKFCEEIKDADLVMGSRYTDGISIVNWSFMRLVVSYFANKYVKLITGLPFTDCMGGYKCFRCSALKTIDLDKIVSPGYVFQAEMLYHMYKRGYRIKEIPIIFYNRKHGRSKMDFREVFFSFFIVLYFKFALMTQSKTKKGAGDA